MPLRLIRSLLLLPAFLTASTPRGAQPPKRDPAPPAKAAVATPATRATKKPATKPAGTAAASPGTRTKAGPVWPNPNAPAPLPGSILPQKRIVAYYGNPLSKRMGILGEVPQPDMFAR